MKNASSAGFQLLLEKTEQMFKSSHPECERRIREWRSREISLFQEDLRLKINGRISERWFYTHIKQNNEGTLPRVDMLNLLSQYAGYRDWEIFCEKNKINGGNNVYNEKHEKKTKRGYKLLLIGLSVIVFFLLLYFFTERNNKMENTGTYKFRFIDSDTRQIISNAEIEVLSSGEFPRTLQADSTGCLSLKNYKQPIRFVVKTPYYKADTISRSPALGQSSEDILLKTDDYALMIHLFSNSKVEDWEKRRKQLDAMISDDVMIFQVYEKNQKGMELYDKWGFIDKLTMPLQSLKNIKILEIKYTNGKITGMRFTESENK